MLSHAVADASDAAMGGSLLSSTSVRRLLDGRAEPGDQAMRVTPDIKLAGASAWENNLYDLLNSHVAEENELLGAYRKIVDDAGSTDVAFLVQLILEDEIRHHRLFADLAATLKAQVELTPSSVIGAARVPDVPFERADSAALLAMTDELIALERDDQRTLRTLRKELKPLADTTLWSVIVETIELDTKKHLVILGHLRRLAKRGKP